MTHMDEVTSTDLQNPEQLTARAMVYGKTPWLVPEAPRRLREFLLEHGTPLTLRRGETLPFGAQSRISLVEDGLIGTLPLHLGDTNRVCGLFGAGSVMGLVMALRMGNTRPASSGMQIFSKVFVEARLRAVPIERFLTWFSTLSEADSQALYRAAILITESQLEGVFVNDIYPVHVRLLIVLEVLGRGRAVSEDGLVELAHGLTLADIAQILHTKREMVSRAFSLAQRAGVVVRRGRVLGYSPSALGVALKRALS